MVYYLIICPSLTQAQKTARVLERAGVSALVMRPPVTIPEKGCAYCVRIPERRLTQALTAMNKAGLGHGKIYVFTAGGRGREVAE